jgi:hypothetical protein
MGTADQDVAAAGSGVTQDATGNPTTTPLSWALTAVLFPARLLGLSKDYAETESSNVTSSRWDQITTLAKVLTRTHKHSDGNTYDIWDAVHTILKAVLVASPHINDDEVDSVNYKAPTT